MIDATLREMASSAGLSGAQTEEVLRILEEYLAELERGARPHPEELLARHPDLADLLKEYLDRLDLLHEAAVRFRVAEPPVDAPVGAGSPAVGAGSPDPAPAPPNDLGQLGDFQLLREVGRGGMGIVYEAEQISLGRRRVALKTLQFAGTMDPRQLTRFQNEARAAACLHHTNIVPVYAVGSERGIHYYAMQFIDGQDLASAVTQLRAQAGHKEPPPQPAETVDAPAGQPAASPTPDTRPIAGLHTERSTRPAEYFRTVARLGIQAAEALDHAHQQGIVHRDIKPANLMVDAAGQLWVTDFGLALIQTDVRLSMSGDLIGTLRYMSPEQALGKRAVLDLRTDIYSLGATLHELLTLEPVHDGKDRQELLRQIDSEEPRRPRRLNRAIPAELETIVLKALAHNPGDRYGTAQELANDLRNFLENRPILAKPPSLQQRARKWAARHKALVGSAASVLAVALFLLAGSIGWVARAESMRRVETERVVGAASTESTSWQEKGKLPEALSAARRAVGLADGGTADEALRQRVRARVADLELVAKLDNVRLEMTALKNGSFDGKKGDVLYAETFRVFDIDVDALSPEEAGERIRRTTVAVELANALDHWAITRRDHKALEEKSWQHLLQVARSADTENGRNRLRDVLLSGDRQGLVDIAAADETSRLHPATLSVLGNSLRKAGAVKEVLTFYRKAQHWHRDDFWINHDLGMLLNMSQPPQHEEAIRCLMIAVALRPESPGAHLNLGVALYHKGNLGDAMSEYQEATRLEANYAQAYNNIGTVLRDEKKLPEAENAFRKAIELNPKLAEGYLGLGTVLSEQKNLPGAEAAWRKAIELKPDYFEAYHNLMLLLFDQERLPEAETACRKAIDLKPNLANTHYILGIMSNAQSKVPEAEAAYRKAIELKPDYAEAHCNLAHVLRRQARFSDSLDEFKKGHALGSKVPGWPYRSAEWVRQAERMVELDAKLPQLLKGEVKPVNATDCIVIAMFCQQSKKLYVAAVHFFEEGFAADPALADNPRVPRRYDAACAAALAGCGQGKDADKLDAKKYAKLRDKARNWLWDDLDVWRALLEKAPDKAGPTVQKQMQHWQQDTDFNGVRGAEALAKLPEAERRKWKTLWEGVEALAQQAAASQPK